MTPRVVAVVLNWCGEEDTTACVASLLASAYGALEIVLVDNGSPDGSGERLRARFPALPFIQTGANRGYTGGNNRGIEAALGREADYVLVLTNDTVVEPDAVRRLVVAAERSAAAGARVGAAGPKILYHDEPGRTWFAGGELLGIRIMGRHLGEGEPDTGGGGGGGEGGGVPVTFLTGCCLLLPATVVREQGAFDESLFAYLEDVELGIRLAGAGYTLLYVPDARIRHRVARGRGRETPFQVYLRERNRVRVMRKHYRGLAKARFYLFFVPSRLVRTAQYLARGRVAHAVSIWKGALGA
ncbi:MAG: glycosyltransferase family 2 protein [Longimicrobiales bacterium]